MKNFNKAYLYFILFTFIFALLQQFAFADSVDEIIEAQKELKLHKKEEFNEKKTREELVNETKDAVMMGKKEYIRTCSLCHGLDAKGKGVYAFELNSAPSNLTLIKKRNNNIFPFISLYRIIDGRQEIGSHGVRDMPIWGSRYNAESWLYTGERNSETLVRGRIFELLLYLESIQE